MTLINIYISSIGYFNKGCPSILYSSVKEKIDKIIDNKVYVNERHRYEEKGFVADNLTTSSHLSVHRKQFNTQMTKLLYSHLEYRID